MGADVLINCKETNLHEEVMRLTNGNGVPRLVEASGASALVNSSFKLLQKVQFCFLYTGPCVGRNFMFEWHQDLMS